MRIKMYKKCLELVYVNTFFSKAMLFVIILSIISYIVPFILAYQTKGFWLKKDRFYEQPDIKFKYEYIFIGETNKFNTPIFCSNIFNNKYNHMDFCSELKLQEIDYDKDGKNDELNIKISLSNLQDLKILGVTLILVMDYKLHTECKVHMESPVIIQHFHPNPGVEMTLIGEVLLQQTVSIPCSNYKIFNEYNKPVINKQESFDLKNLFTEEYYTRNISLMVKNTYLTWIVGATENFNMNIRLKYPEHKINYTPLFWQVIKFAWIQYLSLFILCSWIVNKLKDYIFVNHIVSYYVDKTLYNKIK